MKRLILIALIALTGCGETTKYVDRNVTQYVDRNVTQYVDRNVTQYVDRNVTQYVDRNVTQYVDRNVTIIKYLDRNETVFSDENNSLSLGYRLQGDNLKVSLLTDFKSDDNTFLLEWTNGTYKEWLNINIEPLIDEVSWKGNLNVFLGSPEVNTTNQFRLLETENLRPLQTFSIFQEGE